MLEGQLKFDSDAGEAGVLLGVDDANNSGYFVRFSLGSQTLQFGKIGGAKSWYLDNMPELDRPLEIRKGSPMSYRIVVDKSALVAYVNERIALSARMYAKPFARCGLFADGAAVSVAEFACRPILV